MRDTQRQIDFLIVGAQKAASSYLHEQLRTHPEVYMPPFETPFFEDPHYVRHSWSEVMTLVADAKPQQIRGLKRPDWLGRPECPERVATHAPEAKLIIALRDPVRRAVSAYFWYVQVGLLPLMPIDTAFEMLLSGELEQRYPNAREILTYGCYATHIHEYARYFSLDRMLFLFSADLRSEPEKQLKRLYSFLDIDTAFQVRIERNPKPAIYNAHRLRWRSFANRHFFYKSEVLADGYRMQTQDIRLHSKIAFYTFAAVDRLVLSRFLGNEQPRMSAQTQTRLRAYFLPEVEALESLLERSLAHWK